MKVIELVYKKDLMKKSTRKNKKNGKMKKKCELNINKG